MTGTAARRITTLLIVGTAVLWIGWDVFLGMTHAETESQIIAQWVRACNALALFLGAWIAHLAWHNRKPNYDLWPLALAALLVAGTWDLLCGFGYLTPPAWTRFPGLWLGIGLPVGHWGWPQRRIA